MIKIILFIVHKMLDIIQFVLLPGVGLSFVQHLYILRIHSLPLYQIKNHLTQSLRLITHAYQIRFSNKFGCYIINSILN